MEPKPSVECVVVRTSPFVGFPWHLPHPLIEEPAEVKGSLLFLSIYHSLPSKFSCQLPSFQRLEAYPTLAYGSVGFQLWSFVGFCLRFRFSVPRRGEVLITRPIRSPGFPPPAFLPPRYPHKQNASPCLRALIFATVAKFFPFSMIHLSLHGEQVSVTSLLRPFFFTFLPN